MIKKNNLSKKTIPFFFIIALTNITLQETATAECLSCIRNKSRPLQTTHRDPELLENKIIKIPLSYSIDLSFASLLNDQAKRLHAGFLQIKMIIGGFVNNVQSEYYFKGIYCILPGSTNEDACHLEVISEQIVTIKGTPTNLNAIITGSGQNATIKFPELDQISQIKTSYSYQTAGNFSSLQFNF